jgi:hypothetical protein
MRKLFLVAAVVIFAGCTPFAASMLVVGESGGGEVTRVDVEGFPFVVQQSANRDSAWGAMRDEAREPPFMVMSVIDRRRRAIAAIELVSKCKVRPELIQEVGPGVIFAEVDC